MTEDALAVARSSIAWAVETLSAGGAPDEALAAFTPARRRLGIPRQASLKPIGRVWRLGVLLLDRDGGLYAAGLSTRAIAPGWANNQSVSAEQRREYRAAAHRGPFGDGEVVDFDATPIPLEAEALADPHGRVFLADGELLVRWSDAVSGGIRFDAYLRERVELLLHRPEGA